MPRAVLAHPLAAGGAVLYLGRDRLEDRLDRRPGLGGSAGHDRRTEEGPFLAARDARADIEQALRLDVRGAPARVLVVGVAAVDDDVARGKQGNELLDGIVH